MQEPPTRFIRNHHRALKQHPARFDAGTIESLFINSVARYVSLAVLIFLFFLSLSLTHSYFFSFFFSEYSYLGFLVISCSLFLYPLLPSSYFLPHLLATSLSLLSVFEMKKENFFNALTCFYLPFVRIPFYLSLILGTDTTTRNE